MTAKRLFRRIAILAACLAMPPAIADDATAAAPFFADNTPLEIDFELDLGRLCKNPASSKCEDLAGAITYAEDDGSPVRLDVMVRTRGRWSKRTSACVVPALFVYFDSEQTPGTLFEGQTMMPLTTHCRHGHGSYHAYVIKEYLAHRIYNLITPASLNARLVDVKYRLENGKLRYRRYGFFSEHFANAARRLDAELHEVHRLDPRKTDPTDLATLSVFQYMIGNLDWSVPAQHNVVLFERDDGTVVAVPYDFDYSGIVNAEYAHPPEFARVRNVQDRLYRGFCRPDIDWDEVFRRFLDQRDRVMDAIETAPGLVDSRRDSVRSYINQFWEILETEKMRNNRIVNACRIMPPPGVIPSDSEGS